MAINFRRVVKIEIETRDRENVRTHSRLFALKPLYLYLLTLSLLLGCTAVQEATAPVVPIMINGTECRQAMSQNGVAEPSAVQIFIAATDFEIGTPRIPLVLMDGTEPAKPSDVYVTLFDMSVEPPVPAWCGDAVGYEDYDVPYWTVHPEIASEGFWGLLVEATLPDGTVEQYQRSMQVVADTAAPNVGERPPPVVNRTLKTHEIGLLTSGKEPVPALYDSTVADALRDGRPTVVVFATPAFCATQYCAPVVNSIEDVYEQMGEAADFIHLEIFSDFNAVPMTTAAEVLEWNLPSEPWTFVIDRDGRIAHRMAGPIAPSELLTALAPLIDRDEG